jgi:hypothetical protein
MYKFSCWVLSLHTAQRSKSASSYTCPWMLRTFYRKFKKIFDKNIPDSKKKIYRLLHIEFLIINNISHHKLSLFILTNFFHLKFDDSNQSSSSVHFRKKNNYLIQTDTWILNNFIKVSAFSVLILPFGNCAFIIDVFFLFL